MAICWSFILFSGIIERPPLGERGLDFPEHSMLGRELQEVGGGGCMDNWVKRKVRHPSASFMGQISIILPKSIHSWSLPLCLLHCLSPRTIGTASSLISWLPF